MAYRNLYKPISQFVDPMSTEIAEELRNRFLSNYSGASQVEQEMAQLRAAPFDSDQKLRDELVNNTMATLTGVSQRGDYENMTVPVMNAAKNYQVNSLPIKQNYELYTAYQDEQKERYDAGDIDYEQYQGNIKLSKGLYKGLSKDQAGNYSNYFRGIDAINLTDTKIQERVHSALNGIVAEEYGSGAQIVGIDHPSGQLLVLAQGEVRTVSSERVQGVMDMIMSDQQIQMYMQRKGQIRAADLTAEQLIAHKADALEMHASRIQALQEEQEKTNDEETKARYEQAIQETTLMSSKIAETTDIEMLRAMYAAGQAAGIEQQFRAAAEDRYGYYTESTNMSVLPEYLQGIAGGGLAGTPGAYTAIPGEIEQVANPSGNTIEALTASSAEQSQVLRLAEDPEYMMNRYNIPLTGSEILNMSTQEFNASYGDQYSTVFFERAKTELLNAQATKVAIDKRIRELRETLNLPEEVEFQEIRSIPGMAEVLGAISSKLGVSEEKALERLEEWDRFRSEYQMHGVEHRGKGSLEQMENIRNNIEGFNEINELFGNPDLPEGSSSLVGQAMQTLFFDDTPRYNGHNINRLLGKAGRIRDDIRDQIDEYLEDNSTVSTSFPTYDNLPFGFRLSKAENASLQNTFKGGGAPPAMAYYDDAGQLTTFEKAVDSRRHRYGPAGRNFDIATAAIKDVRYSPYDYGSLGATVLLTVADKKKHAVTVKVPMSEIDNPGIRRYMQSNISRFATIVGKQYARQVRDIVVPLQDANGKGMQFVVNIADTNQGQKFTGTAQMLDESGNRVGKIYSIDELTDPDPSKGMLMILQQNGYLVKY